LGFAGNLNVITMCFQQLIENNQIHRSSFRSGSKSIFNFQNFSPAMTLFLLKRRLRSWKSKLTASETNLRELKNEKDDDLETFK
jgi:hypothetical protein